MIEQSSKSQYRQRNDAKQRALGLRLNEFHLNMSSLFDQFRRRCGTERWRIMFCTSLGFNKHKKTDEHTCRVTSQQARLLPAFEFISFKSL